MVHGVVRTKGKLSGGVLLVFIALNACNSEKNIQIGVERAVSRLTLADRVAACSADPRVQLGLVSNDICVGADLFFREGFEGNGRSCASCHPAQNNFTIEPAFIGTLPASDPLFVAEQNPALATLERSSLMRNFGLILENVDGTSDLANRFTMRSVPHTLSLSTSVTRPGGGPAPPNHRTGWSGDGAPGQGELRDFQTGAIFQHYPRTLARQAGTDFRLATDDELDRIDQFMRRLGRTNELDLAAVQLLDAGAENGRVVFRSAAARCDVCHKDAGANAFGANANFDTGVERLRLPAVDAQGIPRDGGFGGGGELAFNFDSDGDGTDDSFGDGAFNSPPLVEAADTGPFFHTNAAATLEDAIAFYNTSAFNTSPGAAFGQINLSAQQIRDIGRFLRVVNVAFNADLALERLEATATIAASLGNCSLEIQQQMLELAGVEVDDAIEVLEGANQLHQNARAHLINARNLINQAANHNNAGQRLNKIGDAQGRINDAKGQLGSGLTFTIGEGTLMF
jgi:cytochrome c peroxidase